MENNRAEGGAVVYILTNAFRAIFPAMFYREREPRAYILALLYDETYVILLFTQ